MNIETIYLLISGFVGGFLAGLLGVGGGVIYILILPVALATVGVCDADIVKYTIANSVFAIFVASLSGNILNIIKDRFYKKEIYRIGIPASVFSILAMIFIVSEEWYSKEVFNGLVVALLSFMLVKMLIEKKGKRKEKHISNFGLNAIGSSSGIVSAISGLGGGILIVPVLQSFYGMEIKKAKDISLGVIGIMAFSLSIYNLTSNANCISNEFQVGLIVFPTVLTISLGVVLGSPAGVWLSNKLQPNYIRIIFILLLISVIIRKISVLI